LKNDNTCTGCLVGNNGEECEKNNQQLQKNHQFQVSEL